MSGLEGYNPEFLEQLERIHDHADMVACLSKDSTLDSVCRFVPEWRSLVDDGDPEWAFYAEIASDGGVESHAVNHRLLIWKERGECGDVFAFNDSSREPDVDRAERNRDLLSDLPMLVGIGEAVDMPEGVGSRIWLELVRLPLLDESDPVDNPLERASGGRSIGRVADSSQIVRFVGIDRELMVARQDNAGRGIHQGRDDVIECTPKIVYEVAHDDPESWFLWARDNEYLASASLWIDLRESDRVRAVLSKLVGQLSLQRFQVLKRPGDLGRTVAKVEAKRHSPTTYAATEDSA